MLTITGRTPLVMKNIRLRNERDPITRAIAEITAKNKKTDADYADIDVLEWRGGIYYDSEIGIHVPSWNVIRCLEEAGKVTRKGSTLLKAISVEAMALPLDFEGPKDPDKLWEREDFRWRTAVGQRGSRIMRMRPIFRSWALALSGHLLEDVLNPTDLRSIAELGGRAIGLGDARKLGYGRFAAEVAW